MAVQVDRSLASEPLSATPTPLRRDERGTWWIILEDGHAWPLTLSGLTIGRQPGHHLLLQTDSPESAHNEGYAELLPAGDGYLLLSFGMEELLVNGQPVQGSHLVCDEDRVTIGSSSFTFVRRSAASMALSAEAELTPFIFSDTSGRRWHRFLGAMIVAIVAILAVAVAFFWVVLQ